jgi:class 3 adenylate cyclase/tetratricopeptide (TPR) repeat protein
MRVCATCGQENPDGFKFCGNCGAPLEAPAPAREVRKIVTIVFCDLTGSTALGDRTDPETLRATMRGYYDEMRTILERHGGTVEKFVGDAVMAVFGVPVSHEDDALRAVRAAWEMRTAVPKLGLTARIGVNTGEVMTGEGDTLVTGDAVNVAARLEQAAEPGDLLIGEHTRQLVRDAVRLEPADVTAKGKTGPIPAFRVLELDPHASGVARNLDAPLVGRERELALLRQAYERAVTERSCHLVTLLGPAGVGKTRLAAEFAGSLDATVVRGRCLDYGDGITLWPIVEVLKQLGAEETIVQITESLGSSNELFLTVRRRLEDAAAERPLVVLFEDIHWGEQTFLDLIDHVSDLSRGTPIVLLCLARPEPLDVRPAWGGGKLNATIALLEPLSGGETRLLLESLANGDVDDATRDRILEAADGNPLFVEEMFALAREGGDVRAPSTVQALLQARLDRLGHGERAVIERGAVEGEVFHRASVTELSGEVVDIELVGLVRKELIRPDRGTFPGDDAYRFRHLLIRDAAYDGLPKETRADLHERFAGWLEEHADLVELDEIVGYHLEQAALYREQLGHADDELASRAGRRLAAAGNKAAARGDEGASVKLLERAVRSLPPNDPDREWISLALAQAVLEVEHHDEFAALVAPLLQSSDERVRTHARLLEAASAFTRETIGAADAAAALLAEVMPDVEASGDATGLMRAATLEFWLHWTAGAADSSLAAAERVYRLAEQENDARHRFWALLWMSIASCVGPAPPERMEEIAVLMDHAGLGAVHSAAAVRMYQRLYAGDFDAARDFFQRSVAHARTLGLATTAVSMSMAGAHIEAVAGDNQAAIDLLRSGAEQLVESGMPGYASTACAQLAEAYYAEGKVQEAIEAGDKALELSAPEDCINFVIVHGIRARIHADHGDAEETRRQVQLTLDSMEGLDYPVTRGDAYLAIAAALRTIGDNTSVREALQQARAAYEIKHFEPMIERVDALLVEL